MGFVDLHRHDEFSTFDGFGKATELAELAKELGHTSLATSNHGNTNGLVKTYLACKEVGIKSILGVEGYMLPKYKPQDRGYHLCLFAKNLVGYQNLNTIQYEGEKQKYYNPIWDFKMLRKYSEGLICTSACIAGYISQAILKDNFDMARKAVAEFVNIFGDDFYIEIQPYKVSDEGVQEKINEGLINLAEEMGVKTILTSDSHRGKKEDWTTYLKMHQIAKHSPEWVEGTYKERYMPTKKEIMTRMLKMHGEFLVSLGYDPKKYIKDMMQNLDELEDKCELNYLDNLTECLPQLYDDSLKELKRQVKQGLKERGKYNKQYVERAKEELEVIAYHKFEDYFLMVADYVNWAKDQGIYVGPGRGSGCNSIVNYALRITEVDPIYFGLEFRRFLMKERKKMPDIDIDFETNRRGEVIEYLLDKYKGHSAQICSYGLYKVDNLVNDLAKVCGLDALDKDIDESEKKQVQSEIARIKKTIKAYFDEGGFMNVESLMADPDTKYFNKQYDNIIDHFLKLYNKVRYIGTHAAGVAITGNNILSYTALKIDSKTGKVFTTYDLVDIEDIAVIKFDMLGLSTMGEVGEVRDLIGVKGFEESILEDEGMIKGFAEGNADGVFQFDKKSVQGLLKEVDCDSFADVVAVTAMNRPGPLTQKMPQIYAANKVAYETGSGDAQRIEALDEYLQDTYGTIIYQEQIMQMAHDIAGMNWDDAYTVLKMKFGYVKTNAYFKNDYPRFEKQFVDGMAERGVDEETSKDIFLKFYNYSFNKGHAVGYTLISAEQMWQKVHYPAFFWFVKMKYAKDEGTFSRYCAKAVASGSVVFLPHVNYSEPKTRLRKTEGEYVLQQGLSDIKGVGEKAAEEINVERKKNGIFISYDDFYDRCAGRVVNKGVIKTLKEQGALEFNKKTYIGRVTKYNSSLYSRAMN